MNTQSSCLTTQGLLRLHVCATIPISEPLVLWFAKLMSPHLSGYTVCFALFKYRRYFLGL